MAELWKAGGLYAAAGGQLIRIVIGPGVPSDGRPVTHQVQRINGRDSGVRWGAIGSDPASQVGPIGLAP